LPLTLFLFKSFFFNKKNSFFYLFSHCPSRKLSLQRVVPNSHFGYQHLVVFDHNLCSGS
jgi:hypothetical protein